MVRTINPVMGGARAVARCDALGLPPYTDMEGGLYRGYLTPAYAAAQDLLGKWMADAGMAVRHDAAANLIGRYEGTVPDAPALLVGSHLDSVRDGGRYDGPLGILLGVEAVAALHISGGRPPFPIEVIAFGDEEGSRFPAAMLTSRAVAGTLVIDELDVTDDAGIALDQAGIDVSRFLSAARPPGVTLAYLEAHIEQGPVLETENLAVGTVIGIAAQLRFHVTVTGRAGHAGTTTMLLRRDALAGAAEMMVAIEAIAREDAADLVATVGGIKALPGTANVVPGEASFTLDVRAGDRVRRDRAAEAISARLAEIAAKRKLSVELTPIHDLPACLCDPALVATMDDAIAGVGRPARRLVSGAGHDAMTMAAHCPVVMLFIRCREGISHNPAEHVDPADAEIALQVMLGFIKRLGDAYGC